jgi:hypothetical protein
MCRNVPNLIQRIGCGGRAAGMSAIFLLLHEPWAITTDLSSFTGNLDDPDQPLQAITKTSKKPEHIGLAMYQLVQSPSCIRRFFADYLGDETSTGIFELLHLQDTDLLITSAVDFTSCFCCNKHDDNFCLADFFPGKFLTAETAVFVNQVANVSTQRAKYRPVNEREPLKAVLYAWRSLVHRHDPLRGVRQISWILSDADIELICKTPRTSLEKIEQLKSLLSASSDWVDEWGQKVVDEICAFNAKTLSM